MLVDTYIYQGDSLFKYFLHKYFLSVILEFAQALSISITLYSLISI